MLRHLGIDRFKAIRSADLELRALNLLAGMNGTGKSSCFQALLLLRQSHQTHMLPATGLLLRGPLLNIGRGADAFHQLESEETIAIRLETEHGSAQWVFAAESDREVLPLLDFQDYGSGRSAYKEHPFLDGFRYLSAERVSPLTSYETSFYEVHELRQLGGKGEFAVHYLAEHTNDPLRIPELRHAGLGEEQNDLLSNVRAWLSELSPGVSLDAETYSGMDRAMLSYEYDAGPLSRVTQLRPTNVGFGITYVLPVVIAVLASQPGDVIIVENPESHLHPRGQSQIGCLLAVGAHHGVQVFLETHSDHVLNGIRVAVKRGQVAPEDVAIFFFDRKPGDPLHATTIHSPRLDSDGKVDCWPDGFFDESERLLYELL